MKNAMKQGWKLWTSHAADCLAYMVIITAVMLMPAVPLMCMISKNPMLHWGALLCIPLFVFYVLPMRRNAAVVMRKVCLGQGRMNDAALISFDRFSAKLLHGLTLTLLLLAWALPGLAATAYAIYIYKGADSITVLMSVSKLGGGDIVRGLEYVLLIYLASWLPLCVGMMLHSGARHTWVSGQKLSKGRRGTLCLTWLCSLVILVPFLVAAGLILGTQMGPILKLIKVFQVDTAISQLIPMLWQLLGAFVLLLLPLVPLRHLMIASCIHQDCGTQA